MRPLRIVLRGALFSAFFSRHVMADDAAADRAHDGMVARIVAGDAAHDRAFHAAFGVCAARRCQAERAAATNRLIR